MHLPLFGYLPSFSPVFSAIFYLSTTVLYFIYSTIACVMEIMWHSFVFNPPTHTKIQYIICDMNYCIYAKREICAKEHIRDLEIGS